MKVPAADESHVYTIDRFLHANEARFTGGLSPASFSAAYLDWAIHLANSPGKKAELVKKALKKSLKFTSFAVRGACAGRQEPCIEPLPQDKRFSAPQWQKMPFAAWYQGFLLLQQLCHNATTGLEGVSPHHQNIVDFTSRQFLDIFSPSNYLLTNPEVLDVTIREGGKNLLRGVKNFFQDAERALLHKPPVGAEQFQVGKDVAVTPGKVVYRNEMMELIQYRPLTDTVYAEPMLFVPAWIMKYYILDLSPENSMVKYLLEQGFTVFMISWKNPTSEHREWTMDDYLQKGIATALNVVQQIVPGQKVHTTGYCIGGTFLSMMAAALDRDRKNQIQTVTLFAAQVDFTEAGEMLLFIDQSQVAYLEDVMWEQGYLDTKQMVGAFQLIRSNDLIWSRMVHEYLMGRRAPMIDLIAWNADATRMPYRMHSEFLRRLFLNNDLAEGRYNVAGKPVAVTDIHAPIFSVGTETDHIAPWQSVYKINLLSDTDVTFLLTSGGHIAGIISEPGHANRRYRMATKRDGDPYIAAGEWFENTPVQNGSWWPAWQGWLAAHSGKKVSPPPLGGEDYPPLYDAPGHYVLES